MDSHLQYNKQVDSEGKKCVSSHTYVIAIVILYVLLALSVMINTCLCCVTIHLKRNLQETNRVSLLEPRLEMNIVPCSRHDISSLRSIDHLPTPTDSLQVHDYNDNIRDARLRSDAYLGWPLNDDDAEQCVGTEIEHSDSNDQPGDPNLADVDRTQVSIPVDNWPTLPDDIRVKLNTIPQIRDINGIDLVSIDSEKTILHLSYLGQYVRQAHNNIHEVSGLMDTQYNLTLVNSSHNLNLESTTNSISGSVPRDGLFEPQVYSIETSEDFSDHNPSSENTESVPSNSNHDNHHSRSFGPRSERRSSDMESSYISVPSSSNSHYSGEYSWQTSLPQSLKDKLNTIDAVQSVKLIPDHNSDVNEVRDRTGMTAKEMMHMYPQITYTGTSVTGARKIIREKTGLRDKQFVVVLVNNSS